MYLVKPSGVRVRSKLRGASVLIEGGAMVEDFAGISAHDVTDIRMIEAAVHSICTLAVEHEVLAHLHALPPALQAQGKVGVELSSVPGYKRSIQVEPKALLV
jgi:hypothetical protein